MALASLPDAFPFLLLAFAVLLLVRAWARDSSDAERQGHLRRYAHAASGPTVIDASAARPGAWRRGRAVRWAGCDNPDPNLAAVSHRLDEAVAMRIRESIPGCDVTVREGDQAGHVSIECVADQFSSLRRLDRERMIMAPLKDLMAGPSAPLHAIDSLSAQPRPAPKFVRNVAHRRAPPPAAVEVPAYRRGARRTGGRAAWDQTRPHPAPAALMAAAGDQADGPAGSAPGPTGRALILQNKGGGHGELGYHLARALAADQGMAVTILNAGGSSAQSKLPFSKYAELRDQPATAEGGGSLKINVIWCEASEEADVANAVADHLYDVVFDNYSKTAEDAAPVATRAVAWGVKHYVYVSSAGMYTPAADAPPMDEGTPVKESNGQLAVERYLAGLGLPTTFFRPQYIFGPLANKRDYLDWFFDRICRSRPLLIPGTAAQLTTLTDARDVAGMLAAVPVTGAAAVGKVFNCAAHVTTPEEVAKLAVKVSGVDKDTVRVVRYDPADLPEKPPKSAFPFRQTNFAVSNAAAADVLGWAPAVGLEEGLKEWWEGYVRIGRDKADLDFAVDDAIMKGTPLLFQEALFQ